MNDNNDQLGGSETLRGEPPPSEIETADGPSFVGAVLNDRYLIIRKLGHGGFGDVYLASDKKVSRNVVVKVLNAEGLSDQWAVKKFKQEIEAMARVDHPSIVGLLDTGELANGHPYIVMQYVDGVSLRSVIRPEGMELWRVAHIIRQTGRALSAAHDSGILHRDLKPENIMLQKLSDGEEQVKIIDFGVAKVQNSLIQVSTAQGQAVGTIVYMSPEQLSAQHVTVASDVYALGVIAYEMLAGRRPANPETAFQLLEMQKAGIRLKLTDLRPGIPAAAQDIVL